MLLVRSADDPNVHLVNDTADPLQRSLTCLALTDVLMGGPPPGASSTFAPASGAASPLGCRQLTSLIAQMSLILSMHPLERMRWELT